MSPDVQVVTYEAFNGQRFPRAATVGVHMALLVPPAAAPRRRRFFGGAVEVEDAVLRRVVAVLDAAYERYSWLTGGREPARARTVDGRATVAVVPETCGAGCGYLGSTGIEIMESYWESLYRHVADAAQFDQVPFYELGRNFWMLGDKLGYVEPDRGDAVVTGFAVANRFLVMDALGVAPAPFNGEPFALFRARVERLVRDYEVRPDLTWENTLRTNTGVPGSGLGATDLFASMVLDLAARHGPEFPRRLWSEAARRPDRASTLDAVGNFVHAASEAAGEDLTAQFVERWRFPTVTAKDDPPEVPQSTP